MREINSIALYFKLQEIYHHKFYSKCDLSKTNSTMACEVAMMNPQMDPAMESMYSQSTWSQQPLSPELSYAHSPQGSVHSPSSMSARSPVLSHAGSPMPAAPGCCSPVSVHSPNMQAAHSPVMGCGSPADNMLSSVKQEQLEAELRFGAGSDSCESLSSLLRSNDMIAAQNMALAPPHMGPPHPREILDGEFNFFDVKIILLACGRIFVGAG